MDKFRQELIRSVAPQVMNMVLQAVAKLVTRGNHQTVKLAAEMFGMVSSGRGGVNVNVQQNNAAVLAAQDGERQERISFDSIVRSRIDSKRAALLPPEPQTFTATSEEIFS